MKNKSAVFAFMLCGGFVLTLGLLYHDNMRLQKENEQLRVVNTTTDKIRYNIKPNDAHEMPKIYPVAEKYIVSPAFLLSLRYTENGRRLYEFGVDRPRNKIKLLLSPESYQYETSALLVAEAQRDFALKNLPAFVDFLALKYPHQDPAINKQWKKNLLFLNKEFQDIYK